MTYAEKIQSEVESKENKRKREKEQDDAVRALRKQKRECLAAMTPEEYSAYRKRKEYRRKYGPGERAWKELQVQRHVAVKKMAPEEFRAYKAGLMRKYRERDRTPEQRQRRAKRFRRV